MRKTRRILSYTQFNFSNARVNKERNINLKNMFININNLGLLILSNLIFNINSNLELNLKECIN